jgi:uncharacterized protein (UPF0333 family)
MVFRSFIRNIRVFITEINAQGAIEYILLAGAIIIAAIIIIPIYREMARTTAEKTKESVALTGGVTQNSVTNEIGNL